VRLRPVVGAGVVLVAVVAAVALLRTHPAPPGPEAAPPVPTSGPPPVVDARSVHLTSAFLHADQLPTDLRITADPGSPGGFQFRRYIEPELGLDDAKYSAQGLLVRTSDNAVLDHVTVTVAHLSDDDRQTGFGACEPTGSHDGSSCTQRVFPDGTKAKVVRNPAFAQSVASEVTTGARPGIQTQLDAVFTNRTLLVVTLDALNGAGIPMADADMLKLATIPGVAR
jgi:hypothetical protein